MKKEDFILGEYDEYELLVDGIRISISDDSLDELTVEYANRIYELYKSRKPEIIKYLLNDSLLEFYGDRYSVGEITEKLKEADIRIIENGWGTLVWLNHELDDHIIVVEFDNDLELSYVSIDG